MSEQTNIEWCDATFNGWIGCTKVSPGCDGCYAERSTPARTMHILWGPHAERRRTSASNWKLPHRWEREHEAFFAKHGRRRRVFCASLSDVFDNAVPQHWRDELFELIRATPNLDWLLLTKRVGNVGNMLPVPFDFARIYPHVWLGISVVNQAEADRDIPKLLELDAAVRWLSIEPMLSAIDASRFMWPVCGWWKGPHNSYRDAKAAGAECGLKRQALVSAHARFIDWVVAGGESGPEARPVHLSWAQSLRDQCAAAGVPFLWKQWGEWIPAGQPLADGARHIGIREFGYDEEGRHRLHRLGKKATGRLLDGVQHDGYPETSR